MTDHYEESLDALAHEIWAAAQLAPGEGIVDGVARIVSLLRKEAHPAITQSARVPAAEHRALPLYTDPIPTDEALLRQALEALKAENERLREVLKDADNELDWLDEDVDTCDHSVGVCVCEYWDMRRKMKAALASQRGNADIALLVFAVVCAVWLVIAGAMGWLPGGGL